MSCSINMEYTQKYPQLVIANFFSSTQSNTAKTDAQKDSHIADSPIGFNDELRAIGQASVSSYSRDNDVDSNNPYSSLLRPVSDLKDIYKSQLVFLEKVEFYAYDTTMEGADEQNSNVLDKIHGSQNSYDAYVQSKYRNGMIPQNWLTNYFRPSLRINGVEMFKGLQSSNFGDKRNKGDLSVGIPLPYCIDVYRELGEIHSIECAAAVGQIVYITGTTSYLLQRYGVQAILTFRVGSGMGAK